MTENIKKFLELVSGNEELASKAKNASKDEIIALAKEAGIALTEADFEAQSAEISDDELDAVTGGKKCICALSGGGTGESSTGTKTCACVGYGQGDMKNGKMRCQCPLAGSGYDNPC